MDEPTPNLDDTAITKDVPITTDTTTTNDQMDLDLNKESSQSIEQQEAERSLAALESLPDIEEKLSIDNTNYELLVRRIDACKVADLPDALEIAREAMHDVYPLTEQLWLDWIEDVKKNATTEQGEIQLRRLYQEAEQDYLSIPIWTSYVDFIRNKFDQAWDKIEDKNDSDLEEIVNTTREDLLRAVRATAYHVEKSHVIWNAYADFETKLMEHYKSPERFAKLKQIYLDRLGVLHIACEETFSNYSQLISTYDNVNYEASLVEANKIYAVTKAAAEDRDYYEQKLKEADYSLDVFYQYIENEKIAKKMKSLNHVRNLYERAVAIYCTDVGLWEDYICFMMESAHVLVFLKPIALRAVRNCPWSGALWAHLARFMESSGSPMEEVIGIFDRAISNKALLASLEDLVTLMMAKCAHARRQVDWEQVDEDSVSYLRLTFQEALMYIDESFPETGDPYYRIEKYWAMIEGKRLGDIERAREIWDGVIKKHGRNAEAWLNYIELERSLGNIHRCTSLFKQAVAKNLDYPDRLLNIWLSMEYEEGSVESLEDCFVRINKKSKVLTREWQAALAQQEAMEEEKKQKEINQKIKKSAHRRKQKDSKKEATMTTQGKKRRLSSTDDEKDTMDHSMKKAKAQDQQSSTTKDENDGFKKPAFTPRNRGGRGRGRRGGRVALGGSGVQQRQQDTTQTSSTEPRSNEDFRAMLLAGRK